jgi:two-component system secretion system sensor histidine kinase SalK
VTLQVKTDYFSRQVAIFINQAMVILYLIFMKLTGHSISADNILHIAIISLLFFDAAYISYKNIKNNETLTNFLFLLLLSAWQFILLLFESSALSKEISIILITLTFYQTTRFLLSFLFQESAYQYQKMIILFLKGTCIAAISGKLISDRLFAILFMVQNIVALCCLMSVIKVHWQRVKFVMLSQKKQLKISMIFVVVPFSCYILMFHNQPNYLENLLSYLMIMLSFVSIHSIVFKYRPAQEEYFTLNKGNQLILIISGIVVFGIIGSLLNLPIMTSAVLIHSGSLIVQLYYLLAYCQIVKERAIYGEKIDQKHFYSYSLAQIKREENLKKYFSNFLHDEILQDLLSIKNMMGKTDRPQVKELVVSTLEQLNSSIRSQMQEYHPTMLKSLTLKENIQNLLDTVSHTFPWVHCKLRLDCNDKIFLVEPYNLIIYRIIKELATNALKHSGAGEVDIILLQKNGIIGLTVADNGKGLDKTDYHCASHKGLASINEQVSLLDGKMEITSTGANGTRISITMPMKGEDSYESFID